MRGATCRLTHAVIVLLGVWASSTGAHGAEIHDAASGGDLARVTALLAQGVSLESRDTDGMTPLHSAAEQGRAEVVKALLARGADANACATGRNDATALHIAVYGGDLTAVAALLQYGADVNAADRYGGVPLHEAAFWGRPAAARLLLQKGAAVDASTRNGEPPLRMAAQGAIGVRKRLAGLYVGRRLLSPGSESDYREVAEALLLNGARLDTHAGDLQSTALHEAAGVGNETVAVLLLNRGSDLESRDKIGMTPLHYAAANGAVNVISMLLARGAEINARSRRLTTPLMEAAGSGQRAAVEWLLGTGADSAATDPDGFTAFHKAVDHGYPDVMDLFVNRSASPTTLVNTVLPDGRSPLHLAAVAAFGTPEANDPPPDYRTLVERLLVRGADMRAGDRSRQTALHYAARSGQTAATVVLIARGAQLNATDDLGSTPLHWAALEGHADIVERLIIAGADLNARALNGRTALTLARLREHQAIVSILRSKGAVE